MTVQWNAKAEQAISSEEPVMLEQDMLDANKESNRKEASNLQKFPTSFSEAFDFPKFPTQFDLAFFQFELDLTCSCIYTV